LAQGSRLRLRFTEESFLRPRRTFAIYLMQMYTPTPPTFMASGFDDVVVVGRISLNKKKGKKNLVKIAEKNIEKVESACGFAVKPVPAAPAAAQAVRSAPREVFQKPQPRRARQGAPRAPRPAQRSIADLVPEGPFAELPDTIFATFFIFSGVSGAGRMAATSRDLAALLGARSPVWSYVGCGLGAPLLAEPPRDSLRRWIFGLEGAWLPAFSTYASDAPGAEVLHEVDYLVGGMVAIDRKHAQAVVKIVQVAATRCEDWEAGAGFLLSIAKKIEARSEVFSRNCLLNVREAHMDLRERGVLQRLADIDDGPTFDYFQDAEETAPVDEFLWDGEYEAKEIDPDVNADLAASFLEVLGLRHGNALNPGVAH